MSDNKNDNDSKLENDNNDLEEVDKETLTDKFVTGMSRLGNYTSSSIGSTLMGAVPAFLGVGSIAMMYAMGSGLAGAIGVSSGLSVVFGIVAGGFGLGFAIGITILSGALANCFADRNTKPAFVTAGVVLGAAGAIATTVAIASDDTPVEEVEEPVAVEIQAEQTGVNPVIAAQNAGLVYVPA